MNINNKLNILRKASMITPSVVKNHTYFKSFLVDMALTNFRYGKLFFFLKKKACVKNSFCYYKLCFIA